MVTQLLITTQVPSTGRTDQFFAENVLIRRIQITNLADRPREIRCFFRDPDGHPFEISQAS